MGGRKGGRREEGDQGWSWLSSFGASALRITPMSSSSSSRHFSLCVSPFGHHSFYPDFRNQLKKPSASLDVFFYSFISSLTADPFDFEEFQFQDLLKINICLINMLAHLLIAFFFFLNSRAFLQLWFV